VTVSKVVTETTLAALELFRRGKVRDTYHVPRDGDDRLLMVASDRLSAFDVVLPTPIPGKGVVLTQMAAFWFGQTAHIVPNHLLSTEIADFPPAAQAQADALAGRTMLVRAAERIDFECVVRGYLAGSGWADYQRTGSVCGHRLPSGLRESERLPEPLFTPASKNDAGHDENVSVAEMERHIGTELTERLATLSRQVYAYAAAYALERGIIIADTKFEFGLIDGQLMLIDEILTPDSSRFWEADQYVPGQAQPSLDKQYVRDWLAASGWNKEPPGPELPPEVVAGTRARYLSAYERLTGKAIGSGTGDA
jgi:phosphoribosylaminoimidazole-succinocarboxamide synthase